MNKARRGVMGWSGKNLERSRTTPGCLHSVPGRGVRLEMKVLTWGPYGDTQQQIAEKFLAKLAESKEVDCRENRPAPELTRRQ